MIKPLLLDPANVTSASRTPWGGQRIASVLKAGLVAPERTIGESWELSFGPDLPSRIDGDARTLADAIGAAPTAMVGREARRNGTALLVKLLDTSEPLSVQIHPEDDYPGLAEGESGKPESWYVEHADPGAGIWLGLTDGATRESVASAIERGDDLSQQLAFVPVAPGDFFLVEAGTPHAIGAGVTLVEPQRVIPGKRGMTYRYWDWNRRYDARGKPSNHGAPRALHVAHALAVTRWSGARGDAFLESVRARAGVPDRARGVTLEVLAGASGAGLSSTALEVWRLAGSGASMLAPIDALRSITVLEGSLRLGGVAIARGRTAAIPAACGALAIEADGVHAILAAAR